jgi:hypothetical protein
MMNSVALDIVIGLIFVYILYSLLASILQEALASILNLRAITLRISIERMLNDGSFFNQLANETDPDKKAEMTATAILNWLLLRPNGDFKNSFAGKFYAYPSIKFLAKADDNGLPFQSKLPSYISADNFSDTIVNMLRESAAPLTEQKELRTMEKIAIAVTGNNLAIEAETLKTLRNLLDHAKEDEQLFRDSLKQWFNEMQNRTVGWYKRKVQYSLMLMGFLIAVAFNVDTVKIVKFLAIDKDARTQLVNMAISYSKDSARAGDVRRTTDTTVLPKVLMDSAYSRVKNDLSQAGQILSVDRHWDTMTKNEILEISFKKDQATGNFMCRNTSKINCNIGECRKSLTRINAYKRLTDTNSFQITKICADTAFCGARFRALSHQQDKDSVRSKTEALFRLIKSNDSLRFNTIEATNSLTGVQKDLKTIIDSLNSRFNSSFISIDTACEIKNSGTSDYQICGRRNFTDWDKFCFVVNSIFSASFIGYLLTAFAISLGAPFWFDLLSKFVPIRGTGVNPDNKKPK